MEYGSGLFQSYPPGLPSLFLSFPLSFPRASPEFPPSFLSELPSDFFCHRGRLG